MRTSEHQSKVVAILAVALALAAVAGVSAMRVHTPPGQESHQAAATPAKPATHAAEPAKPATAKPAAEPAKPSAHGAESAKPAEKPATPSGERPGGWGAAPAAASTPKEAKPSVTEAVNRINKIIAEEAAKKAHGGEPTAAGSARPSGVPVKNARTGIRLTWPQMPSPTGVRLAWGSATVDLGVRLKWPGQTP